MALLVPLGLCRSTYAGSISVDIHPERCSALYERAVQRFAAGTQPKRLRELVDHAARGTLPAAELVELKAARKVAASLRSNIVALGKSHEAPRALDRYARIFGHLNDALEADAPDAVTEQAKRLAPLLRTEAQRTLRRELDAFEPASRKSFDRHMQGTITALRTGLQKSELPVEEFHALRKDLKVVMNVLASYGADETAPSALEAQKGAAALTALNDELGLLHDDVVHRSLRGELDYDKASITVPAQVKTRVMDVLSQYDNVRPRI